jgi:hypothetical protein
MSGEVEKLTKTSWQRVRDITTASVLPLFAVMLLSALVSNWLSPNPISFGRYPDLIPRTLQFEVALWCRNISFLAALITEVASLPKWQAVLGLILTLSFAFYLFAVFD